MEGFKTDFTKAETSYLLCVDELVDQGFPREKAERVIKATEAKLLAFRELFLEKALTEKFPSLDEEVLFKSLCVGAAYSMLGEKYLTAQLAMTLVLAKYQGA